MNNQIKLQKARTTTARFLIILLAVVIFSISFSSALELNPFAIKKVFEPTMTTSDDTGNFVKEKAEDYGVVKFKKTIFWIESDKLSEETLTQHNYDCFTDCKTYGRKTLYVDAPLFDDLVFYTPDGTTVNKDSNIYLEEQESYFVSVPDTFKEVCETGNASQVCHQEALTFKDEERFRSVWKPYNLGDVKEAGDYSFMIETHKNPNEKLDFVYSSFGKEVKEYAWYNNSWGFYRPIYMNLTTGSTTANTLAINISNMTYMLPSGCDLRFTDIDNVTELKHGVETNVSGVYIIEHINISQIVNTTNRTVAGMWFGNSLASCTGNWSTAFTFGDDASVNNTLSYTKRTVSGGSNVNLLWNSTGKNYFINESTGGFGVTFEPNPNISVADNFRMFFRSCVNTTSDQARIYFGITNSTTNIAYQLARGVRGDTGASKLTFEQTYNGAGSNPNATNDIYADKCYWTQMSKALAVYTLWDAYANDSSSLNLTLKGNYTNASIVAPLLSIATRKLATVVRFDHLAYAPFYPGTLASSFGASIPLGITVLSEAPTNQTNFSSSTVYFTVNNSNPSGLFGLVNTSLYINGTLNTTNSSGTLGRTNFTGIPLQDGFYNYTFYSYDNTSSIFQTSNGTLNFSVDTTRPTINVTSPLTLYNFSVNGTTVNFVNWTVNDTHLSSCWYIYGTNLTSVNCVANNSSFFINAEINNLTFYANDSLNYTSSWTRNWTYKVSEINQSYSLTTTEGNLETFNATVLIDSSYSITQANITYNGTAYIGGTQAYGNYYLINYSDLPIPGVVNNTNLTFYWTILLNDGTYINLTSKNQTVNNVSIDNCSSSTNRIANFTVVDEVLQTKITNASIEVAINLYDSTKTTLVVNYSTSTNTTNPLGICLTNNLSASSSYLLDGVIKYSASGYATEYYNIENYSLMNNSTTQNITLYDLNSSDSTEFQLTFKDSDYLISPGTLIYINRQYIAENTFKTVELPKTDTNGQATVHLVRDSVIYNLIAVKNNEVIGTLSNIVAFCDITVGNCVINFNAIGNNTEGFNYYDDLGITTSGATYTPSTGLFTMSYVSSDGSSKLVNLTVERENAFGTRVLCSTAVNSISGSLSCNTSTFNTDNSTLISTIRVNGVESFVQFTAQAGNGYGVFGYLVAIVLTLSLIIMVGSSSKEGMIIGTVAGLLASIGLGVIKGGVLGIGSIGIWAIIVGLIFLWKLSRGKIQ